MKSMVREELRWLTACSSLLDAWGEELWWKVHKGQKCCRMSGSCLCSCGHCSVSEVQEFQELLQIMLRVELFLWLWTGRKEYSSRLILWLWAQCFCHITPLLSEKSGCLTVLVYLLLYLVIWFIKDRGKQEKNPNNQPNNSLIQPFQCSCCQSVKKLRLQSYNHTE